MGQVPGIKLWVLCPFLIQIALLVMGLSWGFVEIKAITLKILAFFISQPDSIWAISVYYLLVVLFGLVFSVLYFFFMYMISSVISSPFFSIITEKSLRHLKVLGGQNSFRESIQLAIKMIAVSVLRGFFILMVGLILFVASFIPILNLAAAYIAFLLIAMDSSDYAFESMGFSLKRRLQFVRENFVEYCGMATFVGLTVFIPGLIVLIMPFAVLGSTEIVASRASQPTE